MNDKTEIDLKVKKAAQMLLVQRPKAVGVKGWELRRVLGKNFVEILDVLRTELDRLGLELKIVYDEREGNQLDQARFFVLMKNPLSLSEAASAGWRVDDLAALAAALALIISRQGRMPRSDLEKILRSKFPRWKVDTNLDRFIRRGYLGKDEDDVLVIGWKTSAEIDQKTLMNLTIALPKFYEENRTIRQSNDFSSLQ